MLYCKKTIAKTPKGQLGGIKNNPWYADNFVMTNRRKQLTILSLWTGELHLPDLIFKTDKKNFIN